MAYRIVKIINDDLLAFVRMDLKIKKLIEICGFEEDTQTWEDITSKLFNGLTIQSLYKWRDNRDTIIDVLLNDKLRDEKVEGFTSPESYMSFFDRGTDGRLITNRPVYILSGFSDLPAGVIVAPGKKIFLGRGVELLDSVVRTNVYIGDDVKIWNSRIVSSKDREGEASYIGKNTVLEDLSSQFCKSVIGSNVYWHGNGLNNAIIGAGVRISCGANMQSHRTNAKNTWMWDCEANEFVKIESQKASRTPLVVGVNNIFNGGIQLFAPSVIGKNHIVNNMTRIDGSLVKGSYRSVAEATGEATIEYHK